MSAPLTGSSDLTTPTVWGVAGAALVTTLKFARDMFRSKRPESPGLHVSMAQMAVALVDLRNDFRTMNEVVIQSHHQRILAMELERDAFKRRISDLEIQLAHRPSF